MTYKDLRQTSQTVRSDLTTEQQARLLKKVISERWKLARKAKCENRGRKLKLAEFPELARVLEEVFEVNNLIC